LDQLGQSDPACSSCITGVVQGVEVIMNLTERAAWARRRWQADVAL
jgi:hypothetical protein